MASAGQESGFWGCLWGPRASNVNGASRPSDDFVAVGPAVLETQVPSTEVHVSIHSQATAERALRRALPIPAALEVQACARVQKEAASDGKAWAVHCCMVKSFRLPGCFDTYLAQEAAVTANGDGRIQVQLTSEARNSKPLY